MCSARMCTPRIFKIVITVWLIPRGWGGCVTYRLLGFRRVSISSCWEPTFLWLISLPAPMGNCVFPQNRALGPLPFVPMQSYFEWLLCAYYGVYHNCWFAFVDNLNHPCRHLKALNDWNEPADLYIPHFHSRINIHGDKCVHIPQKGMQTETRGACWLAAYKEGSNILHSTGILQIGGGPVYSFLPPKFIQQT